MLIKKPKVMEVMGNKPAVIEEFIGRANSDTGAVSIARVTSPGQWEGPGQTPEFDEYVLVLKGNLRVETKDDSLSLRAGQAVIAHREEWVRYSTPGPNGAEFIAICLPAFSPFLTNRDKDIRGKAKVIHETGRSNT
jgi:mannose-6-phosphate isomerase-like protein (cupin superfamily)